MDILVTGTSSWKNKPLRVTFKINANNFWQADTTAKKIIETHFKDFNQKSKGEYELKLEKR